MNPVREMKIGSFTIKPNLVLAPMAGVTDSSFRRLIKELGGVGLIVTEFISVEGITRGNMRTHRMMKFLPEERPLSIQIFGYDDERMVAAAEIIEESGADIVDINCGCPAKKVVNGGGGSSLLRDLPQLEKILRRVRQAVSIPLTMKIRTGWDDSSINAVEVARSDRRLRRRHGCDSRPHSKQGYSGQANWDVIAAVKRAVSIPVIGCGDVTTPEQALDRLDGERRRRGDDRPRRDRKSVDLPTDLRVDARRGGVSTAARGKAASASSLSRVDARRDARERAHRQAQADVRLLHARACGRRAASGAGVSFADDSEIYDQIDEYFESMIDRGVPPDALTREEREFVDPKPRDPKCSEFAAGAAPQV